MLVPKTSETNFKQATQFFILRQVTDFGLLELRNSGDCVSEDEEPMTYNNYKKLWKAPELLRDEKRHPKGTQKGDIYAFGEISLGS